jgi:hypothetical protein
VEGECILNPGGSEAAEIELVDREPRKQDLSSLSDQILVGIALGEASSSICADGAEPESRETAFAALVDRHSKAIRRVVRAILGDSPDVDDVVQSAFLSALRSLGTLKDRGMLLPRRRGRQPGSSSSSTKPCPSSTGRSCTSVTT